MSPKAAARRTDSRFLKGIGVFTFLVAVISTPYAIVNASENALTFSAADAWQMAMTGIAVALLGLLAYGLAVLVDTLNDR